MLQSFIPFTKKERSSSTEGLTPVGKEKHTSTRLLFLTVEICPSQHNRIIPCDIKPKMTENISSMTYCPVKHERNRTYVTLTVRKKHFTISLPMMDCRFEETDTLHGNTNKHTVYVHALYCILTHSHTHTHTDTKKHAYTFLTGWGANDSTAAGVCYSH